MSWIKFMEGIIHFYEYILNLQPPDHPIEPAPNWLVMCVCVSELL